MVDENLVAEIKRRHPTIIKPIGYANVIERGIELKTLDARSAKRRKNFLESDEVNKNAFVESYRRWNFLVAIKDSDRMPIVMGSNGPIFVYSDANRELHNELRGLLNELGKKPAIKKIATKILGLPRRSSKENIRQKIMQGELFANVGWYDKIFNEIVKNGIQPNGYRWLGIRTVPVSTYHLSKKSLEIVSSSQKPL